MSALLLMHDAWRCSDEFGVLIGGYKDAIRSRRTACSKARLEVFWRSGANDEGILDEGL